MTIKANIKYWIVLFLIFASCARISAQTSYEDFNSLINQYQFWMISDNLQKANEYKDRIKNCIQFSIKQMWSSNSTDAANNISDMGFACQKLDTYDGMNLAIDCFFASLAFFKKKPQSVDIRNKELMELSSLLMNYVLTSQYEEGLKVLEDNKQLIEETNTSEYTIWRERVLRWEVSIYQHLNFSVPGSREEAKKINQYLLEITREKYGMQSKQFLNELRNASFAYEDGDAVLDSLFKEANNIWGSIKDKELDSDYATFLVSYLNFLYLRQYDNISSRLELYIDSLCLQPQFSLYSKINYYLDRSINEFNKTNYTFSLDYALKAEKVIRENDNLPELKERLAEVLGQESNVYFCLHDMASSKKTAYTAYKIIQNLHVKNLKTAAILSSIAFVMENIGEYRAASEMWLERLKIKDSCKNLSLDDVDHLLPYLGTNERIEILNKLLHISFFSNEADRTRIFVYLSNAYMGNKDFVKSEMFINQAEESLARLDINSPNALKNIKSDILENRARIAIHYKKYNDAISYLTELDKHLGVHTALLGDLYAVIGDTSNFIKEISNRINYCDSIITSDFIYMSDHERELFMKNIMGGTLKEISDLCMLFPTSQECMKYAYNVALLNKNMSLESSLVINNILKQQSRIDYKTKNDIISKMKKKISSAKDEELRNRLLLEISMKEQELQAIIKRTDISKDLLCTADSIYHNLPDSAIAIEFVKYNANIKALGETQDSIRYAALVLTHSSQTPCFVDLCTESELTFYQKHFVDDSTLVKAYKSIWKGLEKYFKNSKCVYFSPDGILHALNIELAAQEKYPNIMFSRLSSTREICKKYERGKISNAVLYGGLYYDDSNKTRANADTLQSINYLKSIENYDQVSSGIDYLNGSKEEVERIADVLLKYNIPTLKYDKDNGTEYAYKEMNGHDVSILHMSTHGFSFGRNTIPQYDEPMRKCGLLLSNCKMAWEGQNIIKGEDGILLGEEISEVHLMNNQLTVLSACNTGLGDATPEGIWGLQRAYKKAGSRSIMVSLWEVDDNATKLLMLKFYQDFLSGVERHIALRNAQNYVREYADGLYSNLYYWGGFILID